jgi:predicted TIM-barrel fold metal-dependent hydrolase
MKTPWGDLPVCDAHIHFFSHRFFEMLGGGERLGWELPTEDPRLLAARWESELDRHGVSKALLIASLPGDEASVEAAVGAFPERFRAIFLVNPLETGTPELVEAALRRGKLQGVAFFPAMHRYSMNDNRAQAVL